MSEEPNLSFTTLGTRNLVMSMTSVFSFASVSPILVHQSLAILSIVLTLAEASSFFPTEHVMAKSSAKAVALTIGMLSSLSSNRSYTKFHRNGARMDPCRTPAATSCSTVPCWLLTMIFFPDI